MRKYIIMGVQGSGKGTQAKLLAEALDLEHISVGDIFRWNVQHHTKLGAQVRRIVAAGELVSDDLVAAVVHRRLGDHDWNFGFIIDGFPRNQPQARFFLESYDIDAVILLEVPDRLVEERILGRRLCSGCGLDYNLISHRPAEAGVCDMCGGRLVPRPDDTPEAVRARLRDYHAKTEPVLDLFRAKEFVVVIDATGPPLEVHAGVRRHLDAKAAASA
jgi:adenylate kinase